MQLRGNSICNVPCEAATLIPGSFGYSFDEASSICEHTQFVNRCADIIRLAHGLGRVITADRSHASTEDHSECISVFGWSLRRHPDMEAIGALVELQFRVAA